MQLNGTNLQAAVVPNDSNDVFATHLSKYGQGGLRTVQSLADRDAITAERREWLMEVKVLADGKKYELRSGLSSSNLADNGNWSEVVAAATGAVAQTWVAGAQKANTLVSYNSNVYRVKSDIANGQSAPENNATYYQLLASLTANQVDSFPANVSKSNLLISTNSLTNSLAQSAGYGLTWDDENLQFTVDDNPLYFDTYYYKIDKQVDPATGVLKNMPGWITCDCNSEFTYQGRLCTSNILVQYACWMSESSYLNAWSVNSAGAPQPSYTSIYTKKTNGASVVRVFLRLSLPAADFNKIHITTKPAYDDRALTSRVVALESRAGSAVTIEQNLSSNSTTAVPSVAAVKVLSDNLPYTYIPVGGTTSGVTVAGEIEIGRNGAFIYQDSVAGGFVRTRVEDGLRLEFVDANSQNINEIDFSLEGIYLTAPGAHVQLLSPNGSLVSLTASNTGALLVNGSPIGGGSATTSSTLEFVFQAGFANDFTTTIGSNQAGSYTTASTTNIATTTYTKNGTGVSLPFSLASGDTFQVSIARTQAGTGSVLTLTT